MLIILTICLVLMSAMLLLLKKSRESLYLMGLCVSLMLEICGVMIFIAKKGGISLEVVHFLYFSKAVQTRLQYFLITLNQLGYLIAIGRFLFPLFLVEMALKLSMVPAIRRNGRLQLFAALVPAAMLILYFPPIYRILVAGNEALQKTFATLSRFWIDLYLLFAIGLLLYELFSITLKFVRRQFDTGNSVSDCIDRDLYFVLQSGSRTGIPLLQLYNSLEQGNWLSADLAIHS